jgi:hypothetical protein
MSRRAILNALLAGERDPATLAALGSVRRDGVPYRHLGPDHFDPP